MHLHGPRLLIGQRSAVPDRGRALNAERGLPLAHGCRNLQVLLGRERPEDGVLVAAGGEEAARAQGVAPASEVQPFVREPVHDRLTRRQQRSRGHEHRHDVGRRLQLRRAREHGPLQPRAGAGGAAGRREVLLAHLLMGADRQLEGRKDNVRRHGHSNRGSLTRRHLADAASLSVGAAAEWRGVGRRRSGGAGGEHAAEVLALRGGPAPALLGRLGLLRLLLRLPGLRFRLPSLRLLTFDLHESRNLGLFFVVDVLRTSLRLPTFDLHGSRTLLLLFVVDVPRKDSRFGRIHGYPRKPSSGQ
mmetsp:Transcript_71932/g.233815  ORF Transcript_71932/g.233815 Transcript_71932/m.233815 type:complete len:302 (+) Transcript_71932:5111-6016(+)